MTSPLRKNYVSEAKIAKENRNYDKMMSVMKSLASLNIELTVEERDLLHCAFAKALDLRKTDDRIRTDQNTDTVNHQVAAGIICEDMISLIDKYLLPSSRNVNAIVLYNKLKGDCYFYMQEYKTTTTLDRRDFVRCSWIAYNKAYDLALANLSPSSYLRLTVALNMTVLLGEMMGEKSGAIVFAGHAHGAATYQIGVNERVNKFYNVDTDESLSEKERLQPVMEKLKKNIAAWEDHGSSWKYSRKRYMSAWEDEVK